ncbi:MAG TPA: response regulator [Gammaproteobacteria bacterium]|nr:response regulator [Gammaproteobacteria bacterium]
MEEFEQVEILLVEDNPLDAELAMRGLKDQKLANRITWVKDGEEALDYVYRRGAFAARPDVGPRLILLDLKMPRVGGIEVTRTLKSDERTKRIPIVIMTSSREEQDVVETYNLGANSFIVKPLNFESLAEVARQAGFYWLAINQAAAR